MATRVAEMSVFIGADIASAISGMSKVQTSITALARTSATISPLGAGLAKGVSAATTPVRALGSALGGVLNTALGVAAGMAGFTVGVGVMNAVGGAAIGMNSQLEQAQIGFETLLGSGEAAQAFLDDLATFATQTPFEFPDLLAASQRLMAMGFAAKDVIPFMTDVGNAAAALGTSKQGMDRVITALGQMKAKTKVQAEEMMQLTEAGIPAWQILADTLGTDVAGAMKAVEKRQVNADVFLNAFSAFSKAKYGDMMAKQSRTFLGAMSNIRDGAKLLGATAFKPLYDVLTQVAVRLADFLGSKDAKEWAKRFQQPIAAVVEWFKREWPLIKDVAVTVGSALMTTLGPGTAVATLFGLLSAAAGRLWQEFGTLWVAAKNIAGAHGMGMLQAVWTALVIRIRELFGIDLQSWWDRAAGAVSAVVGWVQQAAAWLGPKLAAAGQMGAAFWQTTLLPAMQAVGAWVVTTLIPALGQLWAWLATTLPPVIASLAALWGTTLLPAIQTVASFFATTLLPALDSTATLIGPVLAAGIAALAALWLGVLLPAIQAVAGWLGGTLLPFLQSVGSLLIALIGPASETVALAWQQLSTYAQALADALGPVLTPALQALGWVFQNVLVPAGQALVALALAPIVGSFQMMSQTLRDLTGLFNGWASALNKLALPDWLKPGSPTPLEIGLLGIAAALGVVSRATNLGDFRALSTSPALDVAGAGGAGAGGVAVQITIAPGGVTVNGASDDEWGRRLGEFLAAAVTLFVEGQQSAPDLASSALAGARG